MKTSRILASTAATIGLVGSFGLAHAQSNYGQSTEQSTLQSEKAQMQEQRDGVPREANLDSNNNATDDVSSDRSSVTTSEKGFLASGTNDGSSQDLDDTKRRSRDAGVMGDERPARSDRH